MDIFEGTFIKDIASDPPVTTRMVLTPEGIGRTEAKLLEIGFLPPLPEVALWR